MTLAGRYILNVVGSGGALALRALISFFLIPFLIVHLGTERYGIWVLISSVAGYAALFDLGFLAAIRRFQARAIAKGDTAEINEVLGVSMRIYVPLGLLAGLTCLSALYWLPRVATIAPELWGECVWVIFGAGLASALDFGRGGFLGVLFGANRVDLERSVSVIQQAVMGAVAVSLILLWKENLISASAGLVSASLVATLAAGRMARALVPTMRLSLGSRHSPVLRPMLAVSFWAALSTVTGAVLAQTPPMLIANLMNTEAVARFAIPALLVAQLRQLIHAVAAPMFPAASQLDVSGSEVALQSVYTRGSRIGLLVGLSAAIPLMLLGESFIGYWVGPDFAWTWKVLAVLLLGTVAECAQTPGQYIIVATRDISGLSYIQVARTIVTLGLMVAFLKWTDWGLLGVALAMTLTDVVRCCFFLPLYTCRELHLSFRAYLWRVVPGAAALAASLACATGLLRMAWHPGGLAVSMVQLAATGLLGLAGGLFLLIDKADRQRAYGFLARFRPGPRAAA